jgi:TatD family hydrolase
MIDAHCHLYSDKYDMDLDAVIQRARKFLQAVIVSAVDPKSLGRSLDLRRQHPDFIYVSAGIHPRNAARLEKWELEQLWQTLRDVQEEIVAVGEVGPDFYRSKDSRIRRRQLSVLEEATAQAEAMNLPLVLHARQAEAAALEVVSTCTMPVLFHCFTGSKTIAKKELPISDFTYLFQPSFFLMPNCKKSPPTFPWSSSLLKPIARLYHPIAVSEEMSRPSSRLPFPSWHRCATILLRKWHHSPQKMPKGSTAWSMYSACLSQTLPAKLAY